MIKELIDNNPVIVYYSGVINLKEKGSIMAAAEKLIDHEVRVKLLEGYATKIDHRFDKLETKIDTNFYWILGTVITLFCGCIMSKFL